MWARQLIRAWAEQFPRDRVTITGSRQLLKELGLLPFRTHRVPGRTAPLRALSQLLVVPAIASKGAFTRVLSLNSVLSPLLNSSIDGKVLINHDWRHLTRPQEFSALQRLYRRIWIGATKRSTHVIAISEKTAMETLRFTGRGDVVVITPGGDHLASAAGKVTIDDLLGASKFLVAFAQHTNKRPELAIESLGILRQLGGGDQYSLVILGARTDHEQRLRSLAEEFGVTDRTHFISFAPTPDYRWLISSAKALLILSTDEGYSIPVAEARYFGTPVIVSKLSGIAGVIHTDVHEVGESAEEIASAVLSLPPSALTSSRENVSTWAECVGKVRAVLLGDS